MQLAVKIGVRQENVTLVDSVGVVYKGRSRGMNAFKEKFAIETPDRTLEDAIRGADVFYGLSAADVLKPEMVRTMAPSPLIFAMANPDPEIRYDLARSVRPDAIVATGRSDFPNQVNNVLGFPFIFRGALDVAARQINDEMKLAAARALAALAKTPVPACVSKAYGGAAFSFGPEYIIPKPFDPRVLLWESPAVAQAAMETGVARKTIDIEQYRVSLASRINESLRLLPDCGDCLACEQLTLGMEQHSAA
jgi:malate dehydrogenase (oxaloacetate-decarboxylating)(NADP+)